MTDKTQRNIDKINRQVFHIPTNVAPSGTRCVKVNIPDDDEHEAIFFGAIDLLCKWNSWQRDDSGSARLASEAWKRAIYDNPTFERCDDMIQFRQITDCFLEVSFDGGDTWSTVFDASACVTQGVIDAIDSGTVAPGGGLYPGGAGTAGQCYQYKVRLEANQRWIPPIAIATGDTIEVSNVQGAWYNGAAAPVGPWNCADGDIFALGACGGSPSFSGASPAPDVARMRLVGRYGTEDPEYFDMYNLVHTIDGGAQADFWLQANDETLEDNAGSITFDVEICKGTGWCVIYDFQTHTNQFGWNVEYVGSWNGTRFVSTDNSNYRGVRVYLEIPSGTTITAMRLGFDRTLGSWGDNAIAIDEFYGTNTGGSGGGFGIHAWTRPPDFDGTDIVREIEGLNIVGPKRIYLQTFANANSGAHSGSSAINYVRLRGTGNPTASGNPC